MKRAVVGTILSMLVAHGAAAAGSLPKGLILRKPHRQLADCMTIHMAASRAISYNDASKLCKDLLRSPGGQLTASNGTRSSGAK